MEERGSFEPIRSRTAAPQPDYPPTQHVPGPPPAPAQPPAPARAPRGRRSFSTTTAVTLAVAGLGLGFLGGWAVFSAKVLSSNDTATTTIHGTLTLGAGAFNATESNTASGTVESCTGVGGYSDINAGVAVTVGDATGKTTAVGQLQGGTPQSGQCVFAFQVKTPTSTLYTVTVSHRGTQTVTAEQAVLGVALTLGG